MLTELKHVLGRTFVFFLAIKDSQTCWKFNIISQHSWRSSRSKLQNIDKKFLQLTAQLGLKWYKNTVDESWWSYILLKEVLRCQTFLFTLKLVPTFNSTWKLGVRTACAVIPVATDTHIVENPGEPRFVGLLPIFFFIFAPDWSWPRAPPPALYLPLCLIRADFVVFAE